MVATDAIAATEPGRALGLFLSEDFETVDRALWALFNLVEEDRNINKNAFVKDVMRRARLTNNLLIKNFFIFVGMCMFEEIQGYYEERVPDVKRYRRWIEKTRERLRKLFLGRVTRTPGDGFAAVYPTLEHFVADSIVAYVTV